MSREYNPYNRFNAFLTGCLYGFLSSFLTIVVGLVVNAEFLWNVEGLAANAVIFTVVGGIIGFSTARKMP